METVQRLNDMLPDRSVREGWLVKQVITQLLCSFTYRVDIARLGRKDISSWRPTLCVTTKTARTSNVHKELLTWTIVNSVVWVKVLSIVLLTSSDETKKKYIFEISTARRDYLCKGANEEEVLGWMTAIEKARARFKSDAAIRKTFLLPTTIGIRDLCFL